MDSYCNNCNKYGHNFYHCHIPIISHGIITYKKNKQTNRLEYLMVCRKFSFGYIDFIRGKYSITLDNIKNIMNEMTVSERNTIKTLPFIDIWNKLWGKKCARYSLNELEYAERRFKFISLGIYENDIFYSLSDLLNLCDNKWETPEWGFPKGRRHINESSRTCAIREWCEETGFNKKTVSIIENIDPFNELIIGSNYKSYNDSYYIGKFTGNDYNIIHQTSERSTAKGVAIKEGWKLIRPYNLERRNIIKNVDLLLNKYAQYIYG